MTEHQRKSVKLSVGDAEIAQLTYVQATRYDVDEKGLRKALRASVFDRYTKRVLNRKALELAMEVGEVDPRVVAKYLTEVKGKPFLKYSVKDEADEA